MCRRRALLALLAMNLMLGTSSEDFQSFVGWKGEVYRPEVLWNPTRAPKSSGNAPWVELLSWSPRAFLYHHFLSEEECEHLVTAAAPMMQRSSVMGADGPKVAELRSSYGTFLSRGYDDTVSSVMDRVAEWVGLPVVNHEDMQVLRYGKGQSYQTHKDVLGRWEGKKPGGNPRIATVLLYLRDVENGGETAFPFSKWQGISEETDESWSDCAKGHVAVKARKGDALLFFSVWPNGEFDKKSMHQGCPVLEGTKWTATIWLHADPWREESFKTHPATQHADPGVCEDLHAKCQEWARDGLCEKDPKHMKGTSFAGGSMGKCRFSCGVCEKCSPGDKECYLRNREKGGYLNTPEVLSAMPM